VFAKDNAIAFNVLSSANFKVELADDFKCLDNQLSPTAGDAVSYLIGKGKG